MFSDNFTIVNCILSVRRVEAEVLLFLRQVCSYTLYCLLTYYSKWRNGKKVMPKVMAYLRHCRSSWFTGLQRGYPVPVQRFTHVNPFHKRCLLPQKWNGTPTLAFGVLRDPDTGRLPRPVSKPSTSAGPVDGRLPYWSSSLCLATSYWLSNSSLPPHFRVLAPVIIYDQLRVTLHGVSWSAVGS
jgi:hypothetical protein